MLKWKFFFQMVWEKVKGPIVIALILIALLSFGPIVVYFFLPDLWTTSTIGERAFTIFFSSIAGLFITVPIGVWLDNVTEEAGKMYKEASEKAKKEQARIEHERAEKLKELEKMESALRPSSVSKKLSSVE